MAKQRWTTDAIPDQAGRVAIVTGGNSGIGYEAAKALAAKAATVIVASRSEQRGSQAAKAISDQTGSSQVRFMKLDLADLSSVREFVEAYRASYDRLDLLINNAGVMMPTEREETADGFELQLGTNHLGHFALTLPLLDRLHATAGARVVNVSSSAQNFGKLDLEDLQWTARPYRRMPSYGASKIANMLFTLELQRRFDSEGVSTIAAACHPGWTSTNLQKSSPFIRLLNPVFGMQPAQGALPTLHAAVSADVEGGGYYGPDGLANMRGYPVGNKPAAASVDAETARRLWDRSAELVGMTDAAPAVVG